MQRSHRSLNRKKTRCLQKRFYEPKFPETAAGNGSGAEFLCCLSNLMLTASASRRNTQREMWKLAGGVGIPEGNMLSSCHTFSLISLSCSLRE